MAVSSSSRSKAVVNKVKSYPDHEAIVTSITTILKTLNPQSHNSWELISSEPLNHFSHRLNPSLVIRVINHQTDPFHGLFFFNWASNPNPNPKGYSHDHLCFVAITDLLLSHSLFSSASSLLLRSNRLRDFMIGKFVKALGDRGDVRAAIDWLHRAKAIERGRCLFSYNAILGVLVRANRVTLAKAFYDQIVEEGLVTPDVYTYTTMIRGFCKTGLLESARKVFDEMLCEPNLVTWNTMISGFCDKGEMGKARIFLGFMMETKDCHPDAVTYTTLINGYCKKGDATEAVKCLSEMVKRGCEPNVSTYNALVHGLCLIGDFEEAKAMISRMRLSGFKDDVVTHMALLKGLWTARKCGEAVRHVREMVRLGINPDVKAYTFLVNECCKIGRPSEAILILEDMREQSLSLHVSSFNAVINSLCENGEIDKAIRVLKEMPQKGCSPNFVSYNTVLSALFKSRGRMLQIEDLVDSMIREGHELDCTLYSCLVKCYCDNGDLNKGMRVFYGALDKNYVICFDSFSEFINKLLVIGETKEVEMIFEDLSRRCNVVDISIYRKRLDELLRKHSGENNKC